LKSPDVRERLIALRTEVADGSPEQVQAFLDNEVEKWARVATYKTITAE
jgi:tripartite-type tricarboxylate transporter receptor subunit TctC